MTRILSLLFVLIAVAAPSIAGATDEITKDEYSVYSDLINSRFLRRGTNLAIIETRTHFEDRASIPNEFADDMQGKFGYPFTLQRRFHLRTKYLLVTSADLKQLITDDDIHGFDLFWKKYPKSTGLLTLSRVAFNATKTRAFLSASNICGPLCGYGYTFVLEKQNGAWKITDEKQLWIS
jgi:hypothetical protein